MPRVRFPVLYDEPEWMPCRRVSFINPFYPVCAICGSPERSTISAPATIPFKSIQRDSPALPHLRKLPLQLLQVPV